MLKPESFKKTYLKAKQNEISKFSFFSTHDNLDESRDKNENETNSPDPNQRKTKPLNPHITRFSDLYYKGLSHTSDGGNRNFTLFHQVQL